ncbi:MAG: VapE domain-containing protein [Betaproteobacteria bacterium]
MFRVSSKDKARIENYRQSLIDHGYHTVAVKTGGKAPQTKNWGNIPPVRSVDDYQANTGLLAGEISVIDIDIEDQDSVAAIVDHCVQHIGDPIMRSRGDSARVALIYRSSSPNRTKSKICTQHGDIEILGSGQQIVVDGIHPNGSRYQLSDLVTFDELPELNDIEIARLKRKFGMSGSTVQAKDSITEGSRNEGLYIYGIQNAGGRSYDELYDLLNEKNQTECTPPLEDDEVAQIAGSVYQSNANKQKNSVPQDLERTEKGKIKPTYENFEKIMTHSGFLPVFNVISKQYGLSGKDDTGVIFIHGERAYAQVINELAKLGCPKGMVDDYFAASCLDREINPIKDWITAIPWDGVDRIKILYASLGVADDIDSKFGLELLTKWLVTGVRAAVHPDGVAAQGILVLQGPQNIGKTTWLKSLLRGGPNLFLEGAILQPDTKDSVLYAISHWLVELGELDATFKKADVSKLKAFITSATDVVRKPYGKAPESYARRTFFCASVNPESILTDETGNRRYWVLPVTEQLDIQHQIDMQQVWAQAHSLYENNYAIHLSKQDCETLESINRQFERKGLLDTMVQHAYLWETARSEWIDWKTAGDILMEMGFRTEDGTKNSGKLGLVLKSLDVEKKRTNSGMRYLMPPVDQYRIRLINY